MGRGQGHVTNFKILHALKSLEWIMAEARIVKFCVVVDFYT